MFVMLVLLVLTALLSAAGFGFLIFMIVRDEPLLGAAGLTVLCVAGLTGAAYGLLTSAP